MPKTACCTAGRFSFSRILAGSGLTGIFANGFAGVIYAGGKKVISDHKVTLSAPQNSFNGLIGIPVL